LCHYASLILLVIPTTATNLSPQYTNGNLNAADGWATQGSVDIANGIATRQTRLSQVFMVNANDRYLSFTLSGTALDNMKGAGINFRAIYAPAICDRLRLLSTVSFHFP
jgi:hypothetical protein